MILVDVFHKDVQELVEMRKADKEERDGQESKMKSIGEHVGIGRREGSPLTAPKDYPEDPNEYGDPANWNYPVDEARHDKAVGRFNGGEGGEQYSPSERHNLGRRIARLASRFGGKYQYDPKKKQINQQEEVKKMLPKLTAEQLQKLDVAGLKAHLKAVRDAAADQISKDPEAAKDVMDTMMGHLDALTDPSTPVGAGTNPQPQRLRRPQSQRKKKRPARKNWARSPRLPRHPQAPRHRPPRRKWMPQPRKPRSRRPMLRP